MAEEPTSATPLQVAGFSVHHYAGFWRRFGALLLDLIIPLGAFLLLAFVVGFAAGFVVGVGGATDDEVDSVAEVVFGVLGILLPVAGLLHFWVGNSLGGTLGKRLLGLRVVLASHSPDEEAAVGLMRGLARLLVYVLGSIPLFLGWLWLLWDGQKQTWHDKVANSIVIRTRIGPSAPSQ